MQVFELNFNQRRPGETRIEQDIVFNSFCYYPENIYEKRLGSLFLVGELCNILPQNLKFLENLAALFKKNYYASPIKISPEAAFKRSLKIANEFLEGVAKSGDVSWLGNLNMAILNLVPSQKKSWTVSFAKVGTIKILLLRAGQIIDVGKNLEFSEIEPYPLKIFGNIVSGKLIENDIISILTKELFPIFNEGAVFSASLRQKRDKKKAPLLAGSLLEKIAQMTPLEEKRLIDLLKIKEKELLKSFGLLFICNLAASPLESIKGKTISFKRKPEKFSLKKLLLPKLNIGKKLNFFKSLKLPKLPSLKSPKLSLPKLALPKLALPKLALSFPPSKNLIIVIVFLLFLFSGFLLFRGERKQELKVAVNALEQIKLKEVQADNFLIMKNEARANIIFQEAWKEVLPQTKAGTPQKEEALALKNSIEEKLFSLNKVEIIGEPNLFFEFKPAESDIIPQKMLTLDSALYFSNPFSSKIYKLNIKEKQGESLETNRRIKLGGTTADSVLFFSSPDVLLILADRVFQEKTINKPSNEFNFDRLFGFKSNIFFLDNQLGEIARYSMSSLFPQLWLNPQAKKPVGAISFAIDGSIWVLTKDNQIDRYSGGLYRETLKTSFFPYLKSPIKIWTSENNSSLYILEPSQSRLIILTKEGKIIKQFRSDKFDNLLDFAVSPDGKTIWLLSGSKVYQINL